MRKTILHRNRRTVNNNDTCNTVVSVKQDKLKFFKFKWFVRIWVQLNLGLAWSQSGNNKTVQTLLSLFKSYYQGRKYALQSKVSYYLKWEKHCWSLLSHKAILHSWCSFTLSCTSLHLWITIRDKFNILQRKLTSWAQRDTTLHKTITFTD